MSKQKKTTNKKYTVCLDAGHHKGSPNGSPDGTYKEYEFAWDICRRMKTLLEKNNFNVVMTKDSQDEYKTSTNRAQVSNDAKADLFVSAHTNASGGSGWSSARGLEIYTSQADVNAGRNIVANKIIDQMRDIGVTLRNTPLRHDSFTVLMKTYAPACLIEFGFHTNQEDVRLLNISEYRDKLAEATVRGICDYFGVEYKEKEDIKVIDDVQVDDSDVSDWAKDAWNKAVDIGLFDGTRAKDGMTREEMAVVLDRVGLLERSDLV